MGSIRELNEALSTDRKYRSQRQTDQTELTASVSWQYSEAINPVPFYDILQKE